MLVSIKLSMFHLLGFVLIVNFSTAPEILNYEPISLATDMW